MRLCVVGNSHMGSLKLAWDDLAPARPDLTVGFFGLPAGGLRALAPEADGRLGVADPAHRRLLAQVTGGDPLLDPLAWDGFVLVGLAVNLRQADPALWPDRRLSSALRAALVRARFAPTTMAHVLGLLRARTACPVWLVPQPAARRRPDEAAPVLPPHAPTHAEALADFRLALEDGATRLVAQPEDTLQDGFWTDARYGEGAVGLATATGARAKDAGDHGHMNAAFGRRLWDLVLADPAFSR